MSKLNNAMSGVLKITFRNAIKKIIEKSCMQ